MKILLLVFGIIVTLLFAGCINSTASWAYPLVTYNGNTYIVSNENVENIGEKLGDIKYYSTNEHGFKDNLFSNCYKVGTELYSIENTSISDAIAVKTSGAKYMKLLNKATSSK